MIVVNYDFYVLGELLVKLKEWYSILSLPENRQECEERFHYNNENGIVQVRH